MARPPRAAEDGLHRALPSPSPPPPTSPTPRQQRKAAAGVKAWLVVPEIGRTRVEEFGRYSIMQRTGIPARDLRILDPMLSYPSTMLGRERAIVVKLEHIKVIIMATEVLVLNPKDPLVGPFVRELQSRISRDSGEVKDYGGHLDVTTNGDGSTKPRTVVFQVLEDSSAVADMKESNGKFTSDMSRTGGPKELPFEFRALEVCLECVCRRLELETSTLEQEAYPVLDELTSKISNHNLERVRQIKSHLVMISVRVQKVRDELERLLDDDMDMAEMYLTKKLVGQQLQEVSLIDVSDNEMDERADERDEFSKSKTRGSKRDLSFMLGIGDLEMLLEAYFVQTDGILNTLSALREYVDDTEDYINIMLNDKQIQLLQMSVMLFTATLILSAGIVVVGCLGMNIHISLFDAVPKKFWETVIGCMVSCVVLYISVIMWGKRSGLLS